MVGDEDVAAQDFSAVQVAGADGEFEALAGEGQLQPLECCCGGLDACPERRVVRAVSGVYVSSCRDVVVDVQSDGPDIGSG